MLDPSELLAAAAGGTVLVAPVGTAQPASEVASLDAAWRELGYITDAGVTLTPAKTTQDIMAWQSPYPVRRLTLTRSLTMGFGIEQWNGDTVELAFDGGVLSQVSSGHYSFALPLGDDAEIQKALMVGFSDGSKHYRWIFPKCRVDSVGAVPFSRTAISPLDIVMSAIGTPSVSPGVFLTNDPGFNPSIYGY